MAVSKIAAGTGKHWPVPEIHSPHQPRKYTFPKRVFGKKVNVCRSFQPQWFDKWEWLHYDEGGDKVFCHLCVRAYSTGRLRSYAVEPTFISSGFTNWKDACVKFVAHEVSQCHQDSVFLILSAANSLTALEEALASRAREKSIRRDCFMKTLENIRFLARQGLPLQADGNEDDSNFMQLLHLRSIDNPDLKEWPKLIADNYTGSDTQNELLKIMALKVLREVVATSTKWYISVMVDECTDVSYHEQVVISIRWVDDSFQGHEEFIGIYEVETTDPLSLVAFIKDVLQRMNVSVDKLRGQCHEGAAVVSGSKSGVVARLQSEEPKALYTHCYGHSLNLACSDAIRTCKVMGSVLDTVQEITEVIKKSPEREALFSSLKDEVLSTCPGIRVLCPTRWTVSANTFKCIFDNYEMLLETWEKALESGMRDTGMKSRISSVLVQMRTFDFFWGIMLGELLFQHCDNLSKTLQHKGLSASDGLHVADMTVTTLASLRNAEAYEMFCLKATIAAKALKQLRLNEPGLSRPRKMPRRHGTSSQGTQEGVPSSKDNYRLIYTAALDGMIVAITDRFHQEGFQVYCHLQSFLLKSVSGEPAEHHLDIVRHAYTSDFCYSTLQTQLQTFRANYAEHLLSDGNGEASLGDIIETLNKLTQGEKLLFSELCNLVKMIVVLPATDATSERSVSAMRLVKSYLRAPVNRDTLNYLMVLHVHAHLTDKLNLAEVADEFVSSSDHRLCLFGKFE